MQQASKGSVSLHIKSSKALGDVAVGICFPLVADSCTMRKLVGNSSCMDCHPKGAEESALAYCLFLAVQQVLCGDPLAVSKTRVGHVTCTLHNKMFGINWNVKGTGSAVQKSIGMALNVLEPARMWPLYSRVIKQLDKSPKKEEFNYVASEMIKSMGAISCVVVGNITIKDDPKPKPGAKPRVDADGNPVPLKSAQQKLDKIVAVLSKKADPAGLKDGVKTKPSEHTECDHSDQTVINVTGWHSSVLAEFIAGKVRGLNPCLMSGGLLLPIKPAQWETLAAKLKKAAGEYANAKYGKVAELSPVFGYLSLSNGSLCAADVKTMIGQNINADAIKQAIVKYL